MKTPRSLSRFASASLLLTLAPLCADPLPLTPQLDSVSTPAGPRTRISFPSQPGIRYRLEKTSTLAPAGSGGWAVRSLVEATGPDTQIVVPEPPEDRAFYRVPSPPPEVFLVQPAALPVSGGELWVDAQCLPSGSSLVFEIEGQPPVTAPLIPAPGGQYRASVPGLSAGAIAGIVVACRVVDSQGVTVATVHQQFEITATGTATLPPPVLPPVIAALFKPKTKSNQSNDRWSGSDADCGDSGEDSVLQATSPLIGITKERRGIWDGAAATRNYRACSKTSECKNTLGAIARGSRPGAIVLHECDLSLATPAGPPMEWTRTYTSQQPVTGTDSPRQFDFAWNCRIVPVPLAAGTSAKRIYLFGGDGRRDTLVRQPDGTYTCDGMFRSGKFNADTSFTLTFADQSKIIFCPLVGAPWQGRLGSVVDANNVAVSCTYTAAGQLDTVSSQFGQKFICTYGSDGLLSKVADHTGRFVTYTRFAAGEAGGNPGDLKSVSCPQIPGQAPLAGPTTYTYTTGNADDALNHNLLTVRDGENRLLGEFTYSPQTNPAAPDYDTCASSDFARKDPLNGHVTLIKFEAVPPGAYPPGSYRCITNDPQGRVTECVFSPSHCCLSCKQYTGFATPGVPTTSTTNRPDPATRLRSTDPAFYETTWLYNGQHLCTRETLPDGTQCRFTHECDLNPNCPVRESANLRFRLLRSVAGEELSTACDYLSGFGTPEGVWAGEDGDGGCTDRRVPRMNIGSQASENGGTSLDGRKYRGWDGLIYGNHRVSKKSYDHYSALATETVGTAGVGSGSNPGSPPDPLFSSNPIPGVGIVVKRNFGPRVTHPKREAATGDPGVWAGEDGDGGCTDLARGTNPDGSDCTNKGRPKFGSAMLSSGHIIPIGCGGGTGIGGNLRPGSPIGGLSIKGGRNYATRIITPLGQVLTRTYDSRGNCTSVRTPVAGAGCDATYNAYGQITSLTVLNGPGSSFTEQCTYNAATGWLSSHTVDPAGLHITTTFEADALGNVIRCVDPLGNDWLTDYNALDCVTRTRTPLVGPAPGGSRIACDYFYDRDGRISRVDLEHRDASGALVAANPAYSSFIVRDSRSQIVRLATEQRPVHIPPPVLDPAPLGIENFAVTDFTYNDSGECVRVSTPAICRGQAEDAACDYQFDERGELYRGISGGLGAMTTVTTQLDYDAVGAVVRVSLLPSSSAGGVAGDPLTSTFTWDGFHRLHTCTSPMGNVCVYDYDSSGAVTVSLFGEVTDVPGSAGNVLLARGKSSRTPDSLVFNVSSNASCTDNPFCRWIEELSFTRERFAPGEPEPHPSEITTLRRSPAGLLMSVNRNGDTLLTNTWDSACRPASCTDGKVTYTCVRDAAGDIVSRTRMDHSSTAGVPPKSYTITCTLDVLGRALTSTDGGGNTATTAFDSCNRPVQYTNPNGVTCYYRWDGNYDDGTGVLQPYTLLLEADSDGDGTLEVLRRCTCQSGYYISSTDSKGYTATVVLDPLNRPVLWNHPDATRDMRMADSYGRLAKTLHKDGTFTSADFDLDGRISRLSRFGGPAAVPVAPTDYTYSGNRLTKAIACGDSKLTYTWDSLGNQLSEMHNSDGVTRTFNHRGRTGITYTSGTRFSEIRDHLGQIVSVSAVSSTGVVMSPPVSLVQYSGHQVSSETRSNGVSTVHDYRGDGDAPLPGGPEDFSFDACVRTVCTNASGAVFHSTRVRRDHNQAVTQSDTLFSSAAQSAGRRHVQTWNRLGHLTSSSIQRREVTGGPMVPESSVSYVLDLEGLRLSATGGSNPGAYSQDSASPPADQQMGRYSSWRSGNPLAWDDEGCLTLMSSDAGKKQFVYDAASQLVAVNDLATGETLASYAYDGEGRRTRSTIAGNAGLPPVTTWFVYDGPLCVQELGDDSHPNVTMAGSEIGGFAICVISRNGTTVYPHGGGGGGGGGTAFVYPLLPAWIEPMKEIVVDEDIELKLCRTAGGSGGHGGGGGGGCGGAARERTAVMGFACTAGPDGIVRERLDGDEACAPIFLTSDGLPRPGATGTLAGFDWFTCRSGSSLVWSPRSNISLYGDTAGRYCPESGFLQSTAGVYSPQLGQQVSKPKKKPKDTSLDGPIKASWNLKENVK